LPPLRFVERTRDVVSPGPANAPFTPSTPLQRAIYAGNGKAVLDLLRRSDPGERTALRKEVVSTLKVVTAAHFAYDDDTFAGWGAPPTREQRGAVAAAALVCGTARDAAPCYAWIDDALAVAKEFNPLSLPDLADELMKLSEHHIASAQRLIATGFSRRPDSDGYIRGLMELPRSGGGLDIHQHLAADPGLKEVLLRVMEVQGTSEVSLASCDKYNHADRAWSKILKDLSDRGVYSRALLLDKTLDTLQRDWIQFRSGWFTNFHAVLDPGIDEMRPHATRYLALLASRIPPTVSFALNIVRRLDGAGLIEPRATLEALRPVFSSVVKGQVLGALTLVDRLQRHEPSLQPLAAVVIVPGLAHAAADVQKRILDRLSKWTMNADARASLALYADGIAATNRDALRGLMAADVVPAEAPPSSIDAMSTVRRRTPSSPLDESFLIPPLANLDELVEHVAYVFENDTDIDAFEQVCGALVGLAPFDETTRTRFAPVAKRAPKVRKVVSFQLARLLLFFMNGERGQARLHIDPLTWAHRHLIERVDDLMAFAATSPGAPSMATPTHRRGVIHPVAFVERLAEHQSREAGTSRVDFLTGLMRLVPQGMPAAIEPARRLRDSVFSRALRAALGEAIAVEDPVLSAAATRVRRIVSNAQPVRTWRVESDRTSVRTFHYVQVDRVSSSAATDPVASLERRAAVATGQRWFDYRTVGGADAASIRYYATLLPSDVEHVCADGAAVISRNLDWWQAQWQDKAYLQELLDRPDRLGTMATLLLALGLAGKEPGQTAVAVDVLVQAATDGRLDTHLLATTVAELVRTEHALCARYAKSLGAALRIDPAVTRGVFEVLGAAAVARPDQPPKDTAALLELLHEICAAHHLSLPPAVRASLEAMQLGGKGKALRAALLAGA
jgi:hypothetical protein